MKILIDSYSTIYQRGGGGIPMRVSTIVDGLAKKGINVKCFDKWNDKITDYDILHIFKANIDSYSEIVYAKNSGVKVVLSSVVAQEGILKIILGRLLNKLFRINNTYSYLKLMLEMSDRILAQTEKEARFITMFYGIQNKKINIIPNGINQAIVESYSPYIDKDIVLCVGRFDKNKNQISLIRAMKGQNIPVHFVGGIVPEDKDYYEQCLDEAQSDTNFVFHGWLKQGSPELLSLFSRAKVCVLISYKEIFGNAIIEGAACGSNLVVTSSLPTSEYGFQSNYFIVNPHSLKEIREAVKCAFSMPVSHSLRDTAISRFSWDSVVEQHINVYENLIKD